MATQPFAGIGHLRLAAQVDGHRQLKFEQHRGERQLELAVVGQGHDRGMERAVCVVLGKVVAADLRGAHRGQVGPYVVEGVRVGPGLQRQRGPDRVPLQDGAQLEKLANIPGGPGGDPHAAAREVLDHALLRQQPQGLAQGGPADAEAPPDRLLDDALAGSEGAAEDLRAQPLGGQLDEAARVQNVPTWAFGRGPVHADPPCFDPAASLEASTDSRPPVLLPLPPVPLPPARSATAPVIEEAFGRQGAPIVSDHEKEPQRRACWTGAATSRSRCAR